MVHLILFVLGTSFGSQFGTFGGILGALFGLALASAIGDSQPNDTCKNGFSLGTLSTTDPSPLIDTPVQPSHSFDEPRFDDFVPGPSDDLMSLPEPTWINPATGLPMVGDGISGVDVGGNVYGASSDEQLMSHFGDTLGSPFDDEI